MARRLLRMHGVASWLPSDSLRFLSTAREPYWKLLRCQEADTSAAALARVSLTPPARIAGAAAAATARVRKQAYKTKKLI